MVPAPQRPARPPVPGTATHVHVGDGREAPAGGPLLDGGHPGLHGHALGSSGRFGGGNDLVWLICSVNTMVGGGVSHQSPWDPTGGLGSAAGPSALRISVASDCSTSEPMQAGARPAVRGVQCLPAACVPCAPRPLALSLGGGAHVDRVGEEALSQQGLGRPKAVASLPSCPWGHCWQCQRSQCLAGFLKDSEVWFLCDGTPLPGPEAPTPRAGGHRLSVGDGTPAAPVASEDLAQGLSPCGGGGGPFPPRSRVLSCACAEQNQGLVISDP